MELTKEYLNWLFDYDRERGLLIWKNHWCPQTLPSIKGKIAGKHIKDKNHWVVTINRRRHSLNKILRMMDIISLDDIIKSKQNVSGNSGNLIGVQKRKRHKGFWSRIWHNKKHHYLGSFATQEEAHQRYLQALKEIGAP